MSLKKNSILEKIKTITCDVNSLPFFEKNVNRRGENDMNYQKKVDMKEVKKIQEQATEIAKILKKEGYEVGVIALGKGTGVATNVFGSRKDVLFTVYTILENLKEEDKLMLLSMILGINLGDE